MFSNPEKNVIEISDCQINGKLIIKLDENGDIVLYGNGDNPCKIFPLEESTSS